MSQYAFTHTLLTRKVEPAFSFISREAKREKAWPVSCFYLLVWLFTVKGQDLEKKFWKVWLFGKLSFGSVNV